LLKYQPDLLRDREAAQPLYRYTPSVDPTTATISPMGLRGWQTARAPRRKAVIQTHCRLLGRDATRPVGERQLCYWRSILPDHYGTMRPVPRHGVTDSLRYLIAGLIGGQTTRLLYRRAASLFSHAVGRRPRRRARHGPHRALGNPRHEAGGSAVQAKRPRQPRLRRFPV
jgi:hypothetical protein